MRLAWFSPMPPVRTGVARCSADLVAALAPSGGHAIEVFVDQPAAAASPVPGVAIRSAHDFVWRHRQEPFDLAVYQLGNSSHHDYIWPYLFHVPGLTILHDAHLHHARAAQLLRERRAAHYRSEFRATEPDATPDAAELAVAGFDSALLYAWPFTRLVVEASRATAAHARLTCRMLAGEHPGARIEHVRLSHGTPLGADEAAARGRAARRRLGIPPDALVFGVFGGLSPEKRLPRILDAFAAVLPVAGRARLLLAGAPAQHYDLDADIRRRSLSDRIVRTGYLESDDALTDCIAAADVTLNLRWPTAREVSGPWLRCLAAGRASVVTDLAHLADAPALDPRTWTPTIAGAGAPIAVAIDVLDEDHSLRLAMRRLARDAALRAALGAAARDYWTREHSPGAMLEDYRRLLPLAAATPARPAALPAHLRDDGSGVLTAVLDRFGVPMPWSRI